MSTPVYILTKIAIFLFLILPVAVEYRSHKKKSMNEDLTEQSDHPFDDFQKDKKGFILGQVTLLRQVVEQAKLGENIKERLDAIEEPIKKAGAIEILLPEFGAKQLEALDKIYQDIDVKFQKGRKDFLTRGTLVYLFLGLLTYLLVSAVAKAISPNFSALFAWISYGIIMIAITFWYSRLHIRLYMLLLMKLSWIAIAISKSGRLLLALAINHLFYYTYLAVVAIWYIFGYKFIYPFIYPILIGFIKGALRLDGGSLFATVSLVLADIIAIIGIYEFIQKKRKKNKNFLQNT